MIFMMNYVSTTADFEIHMKTMLELEGSGIDWKRWWKYVAHTIVVGSTL